MSSTETSPKVRPDIPVYALAAAVALAWRALVLPWNPEGFVVQLILTPFGVMTFVSAKPPTQDRFQRAFYYTLFTLSCGLWSVHAYYSPVVAAPLTIACFLLTLVWGGDKRTNVKLVDTLSVGLPIAALFAFGVYNAIPVYRFRNLDARRVRVVEFVPSSYGEQGVAGVELTSREDVAEFVLALRAARPYSPEYQRDPPAWRVAVVLDSGERLQFRLDETAGKGRDTCHLLLRGGDYQSRALCRLVRSRVPNPNQN